MLKRHQILLDDWQVEYIKLVTETHDISFSDYPNYKAGIDLKSLKRIKDLSLYKKRSEEGFHKGLSNIYFEARKAVEFRLKQKKK